MTSNARQTRLRNDSHLEETLHPRLHKDRKGDDGVVEDVHGRQSVLDVGVSDELEMSCTRLYLRI